MAKTMEKILADGITTLPEVTDTQIENLENTYNRMLGVEHEAKKDLAIELKKLKASKEFSGMSILDPRALRWRWREKARSFSHPRALFQGVALPRVALLNLSSPVVKIAVSRRRAELVISNDKESIFPEVWRSQLRDVRNDLRDISTDWDGSSIRFRWSGSIPTDARETIAQAVKMFGEKEVFLLTETPADKWELDAPPPAAFADPLILGHRGGVLFYLGQFEPTRIEEYVAREFVTS